MFNVTSRHVTSMFKPLASKHIPTRDLHRNPELPERAPPPQNSSMGRKNKSEARKLRKEGNSGLFTKEKDTCELNKLQDLELAPSDTKESEINPDKLVNLPVTCQEGQIRLENESIYLGLGGKLLEKTKAD